MNSKIDWYREVLALEPGSRVFFPLAQLLRESGRAAESAAALRAGLAFHPDHLEAKFMLAELLADPALGGDPAELETILDYLTGVLGRYPMFWNKWADRLAGPSRQSREAALAVRLLASHLAGADLDILGLLEHAVAAGLQAAPPAPAPKAPAAPETYEPGEPPPLRGADEVRAALSDIAAKPQPAAPEPEESGGPYSSVRTRTMAGVLAAQGDVKGALDIYQELLDQAPEDEKPALAERIAQLKETLQPAPAAASDAGQPDKNKLMGVLEMLAGRLEARAGG